MTVDVVGTREIADRISFTGYQVKPGTVQQWRKRGIGFPEPMVTLATGPIWDWKIVERWCRQTGRLGGDR